MDYAIWDPPFVCLAIPKRVGGSYHLGLGPFSWGGQYDGWRILPYHERYFIGRYQRGCFGGVIEYGWLLEFQYIALPRL